MSEFAEATILLETVKDEILGMLTDFEGDLEAYAGNLATDVAMATASEDRETLDEIHEQLALFGEMFEIKASRAAWRTFEAGFAMLTRFILIGVRVGKSTL